MTAQTIGTPKATITSGVSCLSAGDTLLVRTGTYDEGLGSMPSGTSWSNKVRVAAYPGETVWMTPSVHGVGNPGAVIRFNTGSEHYIEFDGINMSGVNVGFDTFVLVSDSGGEPHHIRVKNAELIGRSTDNSAYSGLASMVIEIHGGKPVMVGGHEFTNLTLHGGGRPGTGSYIHNGYGVYLAGPNNLVENCDIYDNKGAGIQIFNDDGANPDNNIVRNNRIHDETRNSNIGQLWGIIVIGNSNQVYNNVIFGVRAAAGTTPGGQGIAVSGDSNKIWNNTVYGNTLEGLVIGSGATSTEVTNNILYGNGTNYTNAGASTSFTNNLQTDPNFVNSATGDFHLKAGSAAFNTGTPVSAVTTDIAGVARPQGVAVDIGAYEYVVGGSVPAAPTGLRIVPE